jgi:hypothetical protein
MGTPGFNFRQDQETFSFSEGPDGNEALPAYCSLSAGWSLGQDADHLPPSSVEVENEWSCTSSGHITLMMRTETTVYRIMSTGASCGVLLSLRFRVCFLFLWKNVTLSACV